MARINLLTVHWGMCYGAVIQTYATCKLLEEQGHEVKVINIIHPKIKGKYHNPKRWIYLIREFQFWRFKKTFFSPLTKKCHKIDAKLLPEADITIVGSDQVWNPIITGAFGNAYFLDFVPTNQKKIALASSFGISKWESSTEDTKRKKELLDKFQAISVRENTGVKILKDVFKKDSIQLLDPSLVYGKFDSMILNHSPQNHIFVFKLNYGTTNQKIIKCISSTLKTDFYTPSLFDRVFKSGPCHWLTNIRNAKFIITDSFHGMALSIIFHKQFFILCASEKKFTRIQSLLELLGLSDRYVKSIDDFNTRKNDLLKPIDYEKVYNILYSERTKYKIFIKNNIR